MSRWIDTEQRVGRGLAQGGGGAIFGVVCSGAAIMWVARVFLVAGLVGVPAVLCGAQQAGAATPEALGFAHFYKCPVGEDVDRVDDTVTAAACLAACQARGNIAGCWWLDGTGGFPRQCRVCRTMSPVRMQWGNDWARPMESPVS